MLAYTFTSIILFPASLLSTTSGVVWGAYLGTFYTVIGATLSAVAPFFIARLLGRDFVMRLLKDTKFDICDRFVSKNCFISVLIMRPIPLFPWDMVNYASGICSIRFGPYMLATAIGTIPGSFTYNLIGASLGKPVSRVRIGLIFALFTLLAAAIILYRIFRKT